MARKIIVKRLGLRESPWEDLYHRFMRCSWRRFFAWFFVFFLGFNLTFATLYFVLTPQGIGNLVEGSFWQYFFFSVQTSAGIGYGHFYPDSDLAEWISVTEAFCSLLMNASMAGLFFARFARPRARILFTKNILWVDYYGKPALQLRIANARGNRIYEGRARWVLLRDEVSPEGHIMRRMIDLKLIRSETTIFALSWTLIHVIDEESPLYGTTLNDLQRSDAEFVVTFSGLDEETSQTISIHEQYPNKDVLRAKKFKDIIDLVNDERIINFSAFHDVEQANS